MGITKKTFGKTTDGKDVTAYTMTNNSGNAVTVIDLGAVITQIIVPDKNGKKEDICLGYDDVKYYEVNGPSFGAVVGRCANRISGARFILNDITYDLDKNDGNNCLHSGYDRLNHHMYNAECDYGTDFSTVSFNRICEDGEQGFPGNVSLTVSYTWNDDNRLIVEYHAISDKDTVLNVTNHCYFNIGSGGHKCKNVLSQNVKIYADRYTPTNEENCPTGEICNVEGTVMDLRHFVRIGDRIGQDGEYMKLSGYDHSYVLEHEKGEIIKSVELKDAESGRYLEVYTDMPAVQFYVAKSLEDFNGKDKTTYGNYGGCCFETQQFPDAINNPGFPSAVLKAGEEFESTTVYGFGVMED